MSHLIKMQTPFTRSTFLVAVGLLLCGLALPQHAQAKKKHHKASTSQTASTRGGSKVNTRPSSSEESRPERERRLLRECHGMPDAGACKGYTRGR